MRLPRLVRPGLVLLVAALAACADSTGPVSPPESRLVVTADGVDTLAQPGLAVRAALRDSAKMQAIRIYFDSAANPTPQRTFSYYHPFDLVPSRSVVVFTPGPGRHVMTVAVTDTAGQIASQSLTRTFAVPEVAYAATALPDLGFGASARFVNFNGDVAGAVTMANGQSRAAVWRNGALTTLSIGGDTVDSWATRVNTAGDVLFEVNVWGSVQFSDRVRVVHPDGTVIRLGPARPGTAICCRTAADLTDNRQVLGTSNASARFDAQTGALLDTLPTHYYLMNNRGQLAGSVTAGTNYPSTSPVTSGFTLPALPAGPVSGSACDPVGRYSSSGPVDLDDSAAVLLAVECVSYAYLSAAGGVWLDRYVGQTKCDRQSCNNIHLSRQGGLVTSLDSTGAVYVWNATTRRTNRVRAALDAGVTLDALGAVNAVGQIVAHGTNATTGKGTAFLLTPAR